jgi:RND family efflux transporter MFP subunit
MMSETLCQAKLDSEMKAEQESLEPPVSLNRSSGARPPKILYVAIAAGLLTFALLMLAGLLPRLSTEAELNQAHGAETMSIRKVAFTQVQPPVGETSLTLPASLEPIQEIPIFARCDGYLVQRFVDIGDRVKAGQLLATIDAPELDRQVEQAEADLHQSQAQVKAAEAELARARAVVATSEAAVRKLQANLTFSRQQLARYSELVQEGAISREMKDEKQRDLDSDLAGLEAAQAEVAANQAQVASLAEKVAVSKAAVGSYRAALGRALSQQSFKTVKAPADGVIVSRNIDAGSLVSEGSDNAKKELMSLAKTDPLRVMVAVPQSFYRHIKVGSKVQLNINELSGKKLQAVVAKVAGGLDAASRTMLTEVHVGNAGGILKPGMYATVKFEAGVDRPKTKNAPHLASNESRPFRIPASSLVVKPEGLFVAKLNDGDKVHFEKVVLGRDFGRQIEILDGITSGERLVLDPDVDLREGQKVEAFSK